MNTLGMITIVVDDYDSAISHYVNELSFSLIEDNILSPEKRWVVVAPSENGSKILLAKASTEDQRAAIGNSTGGRVGFFLYTTELNKHFKNLSPMELNSWKNHVRKYTVRLLYLETSTEISGI